ncbi:MAG: pseudouridine synthase [Fusobacteriia bacterium 4572_132]|nr:MAG: pseudouridine synthase [Fusobacteriia bacterium 4572_132]
MEKVRINKYLANLGVASRRQVDKMIEAGEIKINGKLPEIGQKVDPNDEIDVKGKRIGKKVKKVYYLLNKPQQVLSATSDYTDRKLVTDFIKGTERIYPIGRLDYDTEGIILMTNDGDIVNKILRASSKIFKTYLAKVKGKFPERKIELLEEGIYLDDGITLPAKAKIVEYEKNHTWVELQIREGRNRQVRRMFSKVGYPVVFLRRIGIGKFKIGDMRPGQYRKLSNNEVKYIKAMKEREE